MLMYLTAGESHGRNITAILEGIPAGLGLTEEYINKELLRRQKGYGRGGRMEIEEDKATVTGGIMSGETIGSRICRVIENRDWREDKDEKIYTRPRPGHADLAGALKYDRQDLRDIQERASARETAGRVAAGAVCRKFLLEFGIKVFSYVEQIYNARCKPISSAELKELYSKIEGSPVRCPDKGIEKKMMAEIDKAKENNDSVGGIFRVIATGVPTGLGSHIQWDLRLDGRLAQSVMSIQAVKGVEIGTGFDFAEHTGSETHDEIYYDKKRGFYRKTNNAGGIEGGITNGEDIVLRAVMKPIPSLKKPLKSVDIRTKEPVLAEIIRADVCAVPACSVIAEAVVSFELAKAFKEKFGGDSIKETKRNFEGYIEQIKDF